MARPVSKHKVQPFCKKTFQVTSAAISSVGVMAELTAFNGGLHRFSDAMAAMTGSYVGDGSLCKSYACRRCLVAAFPQNLATNNYKRFFITS